MSNKKTTITKVFSFICILLMLGMLVTQFLPFWTYGEAGNETNPETSVSIAGYVWFPKHHTGLSKEISSLFGGSIKTTNVVNYVVSSNILIMLLSVGSIVLLCLKPTKAWLSIAPLIAGIVGLIQYTGNVLLQLGSNWQIHMGICIAAIAVALVNVVIFAIELFHKFFVYEESAA